MKKLILISLGIFILFSCNRKQNPKTRFAEKHPKGEVIPRVICTDDPSYSYALYLPRAYDPGIPMPVVYAFDPDGDGKIPVNLMKDAADNLGFILVGSNNSRNGTSPDQINKIIRVMMANTGKYLAINNKRIYTAGFSGGSRVACSMALSNPGINGVIACSAGFNPGTQLPGFVFIGIAGVQDMNYLEVVRLAKYLQSRNADEQLLIFNGKHAWPPKKFLEEAMFMLEVYAMKEQKIPENKMIVDSLKESWLKRAVELKNSEKVENRVKAFNIEMKALSLLDGLTEISELLEDYNELKKDREVMDYIERKDSLEIKEANKQQELAGAFRSLSGPWWDRELSRLNRETKDSTDMLVSNMAVRLLGFVSLNCYGFVKQALAQQNFELLRFLNNIYLRSDPENYFAWYAQAIIDIQSGKQQDAIEDLRKSIHFGYPNKKKLKDDPVLAPLKNQSEFLELVND